MIRKVCVFSLCYRVMEVESESESEERDRETGTHRERHRRRGEEGGEEQRQQP